MCGKIPNFKSRPSSAVKQNGAKQLNVSFSDSDSDEGDSLQLETLKINTVQCDHDSNQTKDPWYIHLIIQDVKLQLELDCGTPITVLPFSWYKKYFPQCKLESTKFTLTTWSQEKLKPKGLFYLTVSYQGITKHLRALLAPDDFQPLCGREWIQALNIDWKGLQNLNIHAIESVKFDAYIPTLVDKSKIAVKTATARISS